MKYIHIEDQLYINIPELKEDIAAEFQRLSKLAPEEQNSDTEDQLLSLNIVYVFLSSLSVPMEPTNV